MRTALAALLLAATSGCVVRSAVTFTLRPEVATECAANCGALGMRLGAVVLVMDHAGCVCEPRTSSASAGGGAATVAGGATIEAIAQQQQRQQRHNPVPPPMPSHR